LAYTLCGGTIELLAQVWLGREGQSLILDIPPTGSLFEGETVQRRLEALARGMGTVAVIRRRDPPASAERAAVA
jgi:exopolyphosphatase/guanosine-5'-triphosphate,3'-diphosphate pyrophosphatase